MAMTHSTLSESKRSSPTPAALEMTAVWLLAGTVVLAPVLLGCSGIWTRFALEAVLAVATLAWAYSGQRSKWLMLMPTAMLGLSLLQTMPLPGWLLMRIAPVSAGSWKTAEGATLAAWHSISVDPGASATAARRLFLGLCVLAVVTELGRRQSHRRRLLWALAISGSVMLASGAYFGTAKNNRMLGVVNLAGPLNPETNPTVMPVQTNGVGVRSTVTVGKLQYEDDEGYVGDGFGTYIYSNHFGGGVNLTCPAVLAAWLLLTRRRISEWLRWSVCLAAWLAAVWLVGGVAHSRGGAASLVLGGLVLMAIAAETRLVRWPATGTLMAYSAGLIAAALLTVFFLLGPAGVILDGLPPPWKSLIVHALSDARSVAAQVAFRMAIASPFLGTGLGTYEMVFPRFHTSRYTLFFAHNDYAQFFAEAGFVSGAIAAVVAGVLAYRCGWFCREARGDYRVFNAAAWSALAGIGLHSGLDWNLHLPANSCLASVIMGLCASSVPATPWAFASRPLAWIPAWSVKAMLALACVATMGLLTRDTVSEAVQKAVKEAVALDRLDPSDPRHERAAAALATAIAAAERMAVWDSRDAKLLVLLGQAKLHVARAEQPGISKDALLGSAGVWLAKARLASALLRGLPTPVRPAAGG